MQIRQVLEELALARHSIDHAYSCLAACPESATAQLEAEAAESTSIRLVTENGFEIRRVWPGRLTPDHSAREYYFIVTSTSGEEISVKVDFKEVIVAAGQCHATSVLCQEGAFWLCCAERHLAQFLWETNRCPQELTVEELTADDLQTLVPRDD